MLPYWSYMLAHVVIPSFVQGIIIIRDEVPVHETSLVAALVSQLHFYSNETLHQKEVLAT